jgi:hypothetical protein
MLADGRMAYRLRKPRKNGATHLVMTPVELLAKMASLVPPPKFPLLRFAGVLAPGSTWRASVVPGRAPEARHRHGTAEEKKDNEPLAHAGGAAKAVDVEDKALLAHAGGAADKTVAVADKKPLAHGHGNAHTGLGNGAVPLQGVRIDWASLLKRVFLEDVLACPCGGRRRVIGDVQDPDAVTAILRHLALPTQPPPIARARDPAELGFGFE